MSDPVLRCSVAQEKLTGYLLKPDHPVGGSKARFFLAMGFSAGEWQILADALREHPARNPIAATELTPYGRIYEVRCTLRTPNGRDPCITSVWQETGASTGSVRLITAYPGG